jgi:hypothetical protein
MCATCGCNYTNYNHEGMKVPMLPNGINPMPLANGKIPLSSGTVTAVPKKPKK